MSCFMYSNSMNVGLRVLLASFSACLGILVFPPIGWHLVAVIAWIPLVYGISGAKPSHALYLGLLHGVLFYGVTMSWLLDVFDGSLYLVATLILIMALFTGVFARGYAVAYLRYGRGWVTALFAAVWWTGVEFYRGELFYLKFPWMSPGVGLEPTWLTPLMGVYGLGFLLVMGAAMLCQKNKQRCFGGVLLLVMLASVLMQKRKEASLGESVLVAAVQAEESDLDHYIKLTKYAKAASDQDFDLVIWPEYALPYDIRKDKRQWPQLTRFSTEMGAEMVVGTQTSDDDGDWYNTALAFYGEQVFGEHYKNHTVHFFDDGVAGTEAKAVHTPRWSYGTPICFDSDYQDVIRRMVADGAEFLVVPTMDAMHWGAKQQYQHSELFRHRAAENGRWIIVAATSGLTQVIDSNGNRLSSLPIIDEGVLVSELGRQSGLTFYTRMGWVFPWMAMGVGVVWMIWLFVEGLVDRRRSEVKVDEA